MIYIHRLSHHIPETSSLSTLARAWLCAACTYQVPAFLSVCNLVYMFGCHSWLNLSIYSCLEEFLTHSTGRKHEPVIEVRNAIAPHIVHDLQTQACIQAAPRTFMSYGPQLKTSRVTSQFSAVDSDLYVLHQS